ncbi:MAG TPA: hypothetical protein VFQ38_13155 [Longimicrobiales bacterium]|nr:hypothetical protein [Longimicrobiales bacterium]
MSKRGMVWATALCAVVGLGGCAGGGSLQTGDAEDAQLAPAGDASVTVHNNNWADVDVYAVRNGTRTRLGSVATAASARFLLSGTLLTGAPTLQLLIDPIGSRAGYITQPLLVSPGQRVDLNVENNLSLTSYSIF